jgi:hypothetical protein
MWSVKRVLCFPFLSQCVELSHERNYLRVPDDADPGSIESFDNAATVT